MKIQLQICFQAILCLCFEQVLRDVTAEINPTSHQTDTSVLQANLMFEFLLGGVEMDQGNIVLLDKELASMRSGRAFLSQINDNIPRTQSSMMALAAALEGQKKKPMPQAQFDNLVLSLVYSAHQAWNQKSQDEQQAWGTVLLQLANVTVQELRGSYLFIYA
ncbi:uncharacterized protein V6R79_011563 [Siganus canaliculatus]